MTPVYLLQMDYFNLLEGTFWVVLGVLSLFIYCKVSKIYSGLVLFSAFIFITFGISDFVQAIYGSFLVEGMEWLLIWKVVDVIGLCVIPVWYVKLRIRH